MDVNFSKDVSGNPKQGAEKGRQNGLLVVLLVLAAAVGYVYFFTDLIKPSQDQKTAEVAPAPQVIKKPLPSPDGKPAKAEPAEGSDKAASVPPAKPEPTKAVAAAPVTDAKPVVKEPAKAKEPAKKPEAAQPAVKKPIPAATAKVVEAKPAPIEKKQSAVAEKKPLPAKDVEKKAADVKKPVEKAAVAAVPPKKEAQKTVKKETAAVDAAATTPGSWTVLVGNYVLEEALANDLARVRKAGFEAFVVQAGPKKTHMTRLQLAEFSDRASAQAELDKLKRHTSDAFILDRSGTHTVYAGSYLLDTRAAFEKERLTAAGFGLTLKHADVAIPSKNLTAGVYTDKKAADEVVKKLRAAGVKAALTR